MTLTKRLIRNLLLAVTAVTVPYAATLYAQTAQQEAAQPPAAVQGEDQEQGQGQEQAQNQTESEPAAEDNTQDAAAQPLPDIDSQPIQPGARSSGRFIPSEQISQDLGVSFPVDI